MGRPRAALASQQNDLGVLVGSLFCVNFRQLLDCVFFAEFARRPHESTIIEVPVSQKTSIVGSIFDYFFGRPESQVHLLTSLFQYL